MWVSVTLSWLLLKNNCIAIQEPEPGTVHIIYEHYRTYLQEPLSILRQYKITPNNILIFNRVTVILCYRI
jgi:hypothetical protein